MKDLSVSQFKATMARQWREVQSGEAIVLTEHKRPIAVVQPMTGGGRSTSYRLVRLDGEGWSGQR